MSRAFIRLGDRTTHGGTVVTADYTWTIHGKAVARVGDLTTCPKCKGTFRIATGAEDFTGMGQQVARHGDRTECGAQLIASQSVATLDSSPSEGQAAEQAQALSEASQVVAAVTGSGICLECLMKAAARGDATIARE